MADATEATATPETLAFAPASAKLDIAIRGVLEGRKGFIRTRLETFPGCAWGKNEGIRPWCCEFAAKCDCADNEVAARAGRRECETSQESASDRKETEIAEAGFCRAISGVYTAC